MNAWGFVAGLSTAALWSVTAICFEEATRRMGSLVLNVVRLAFALLFFIALSLIASGAPVNPRAGAHGWLFLALSGLVGFVLGDLCLFRAFVLIGARLSMLIYASAPPMAALIGFFVLGERMKLLAIVGMLVTVSGIALAILGKRPGGAAAATAAAPGARAAATAAAPGASAAGAAGGGRGVAREGKGGGVLLAFLASAGQAAGLVLAKQGSVGLDSFSATEIRVIAGLAGMLVVALAAGAGPALVRPFALAALRASDAPPAPERARMRGALALALAGSALGPFLGVSLGLRSTQLLDVGVASTLMSVVPVLIIPVSVVVFKERARLGEILGAVLAVVGVAVLAL